MLLKIILCYTRFKIKSILFKYPNKIYEIEKKNCNYVLTAETHNFPTGIEPFSGAATGIGGRIRDVQSTGRGAFTLAGTAGYCVGEINTVNIVKNNYDDYPSNVKNPEILICK